eukprot:3145963-Prymnesium_polylepis.1
MAASASRAFCAHAAICRACLSASAAISSAITTSAPTPRPASLALGRPLAARGSARITFAFAAAA